MNNGRSKVTRAALLSAHLNEVFILVGWDLSRQTEWNLETSTGSSEGRCSIS